ncbi:MAG: tetratricopeptide repeat protein [Brevundimonas sp.]|nr:MAG: tetratricopeptide repeat protein [Brevundimonas sp.]
MRHTLPILKAVAMAVVAFITLAASPVRAEWLKAESERFIVYGDGNPRQLIAFTEKLETFDRLLRWKMGLPIDAVPPRKLPIYLVEPAGLRRVAPGIGANVAGFYTAREEDIFAVAIRGEMGDDVLLHEYAHHFMMQNSAYSYPAWFIEGFAEYFATVDINDTRILFGQHNENRGYWLRESTWISMTDLLAKRSGEVRRRNETYYPLAWLMTHWFMSDDARFLQLRSYLLDVGAGANSVEAMPRATGMSNDELRRELRGYMGRIPYSEIRNVFPRAQVTVTPLPASAGDFLLMTQRLTGVPTSHSESTLAEVRRLAARYPDDPAAMLALGHAEIHLGDRDAGEAVLRRLIAAHPEHVEAHQYLARSLLERAAVEGADVRALKTEARRLLGRAFQLDDADYRTFMLLADTRVGSPGYPNENDILTRELALQLAPQLDEARMRMAQTYLAAGRREDAIRTIEPLANDPHGGEDAKAAQTLLNEARGLSEAEARAEDAAADSVDEDPAPRAN